MIRTLKLGRTGQEKAADAHQVKATVEAIIAEIEARGDAAVAELSEKFDKWKPATFRLMQAEIDACFAELNAGEIEDIKFAQAQVRRFAEHQRASIRDLEV